MSGLSTHLQSYPALGIWGNDFSTSKKLVPQSSLFLSSVPYSFAWGAYYYHSTPFSSFTQFHSRNDNGHSAPWPGLGFMKKPIKIYSLPMTVLGTTNLRYNWS